MGALSTFGGWYTCAEMAQLLGITVGGVWYRGERGQLERRRIGGRWLYREPQDKQDNEAPHGND